MWRAGGTCRFFVVGGTARVAIREDRLSVCSRDPGGESSVADYTAAAAAASSSTQPRYHASCARDAGQGALDGGGDRVAGWEGLLAAGEGVAEQGGGVGEAAGGVVGAGQAGAAG